VALIFLYKSCEFGEKICNNSRDIEFFLGDHYFLARPVEWWQTISQRMYRYSAIQAGQSERSCWHVVTLSCYQSNGLLHGL